MGAAMGNRGMMAGSYGLGPPRQVPSTALLSDNNYCFHVELGLGNRVPCYHPHSFILLSPTATAAWRWIWRCSTRCCRCCWWGRWYGRNERRECSRLLQPRCWPGIRSRFRWPPSRNFRRRTPSWHLWNRHVPDAYTTESWVPCSAEASAHFRYTMAARYHIGELPAPVCVGASGATASSNGSMYPLELSTAPAPSSNVVIVRDCVPGVAPPPPRNGNAPGAKGSLQLRAGVASSGADSPTKLCVGPSSGPPLCSCAKRCF